MCFADDIVARWTSAFHLARICAYLAVYQLLTLLCLWGLPPGGIPRRPDHTGWPRLQDGRQAGARPVAVIFLYHRWGVGWRVLGRLINRLNVLSNECEDNLRSKCNFFVESHHMSKTKSQVRRHRSPCVSGRWSNPPQNRFILCHSMKTTYRLSF